jgi:hypothetical protein
MARDIIETLPGEERKLSEGMRAALLRRGIKVGADEEIAPLRVRELFAEMVAGGAEVLRDPTGLWC